MRKLTTTLFLFSLVNLSFAQGWLDLGLKGGYGVGILNNSNIWNDASYNHKLSGSGFFGAKLGLNFNDEHEVTVDFIYGNFKQGFTYDVDIEGADTTGIIQTKEYNSEITFTNMDIILMYRHNRDGRYVEIGPKLSLISNSKRTDNYELAPAFDQSYFNKNTLGMTFGFGAYMMGTENFGITAGARLGFTFSDLISNEGINANQPTLKSYDTYKGSFPITLQLVFEANLDFAYLAKAQCGRTKLLTF